ncbi:hypothetical protein ACVNF4_04615 [Streptomyces sp. S6]
MRLRLTEFRPRTGPHTHRVVRPRTPLRHTSLYAPDPYGVLCGDHDGLNQLAGLFSFAAYSRHTIVHIPLREGVPPNWGTGEPVDLLLIPDSYGLRPSGWPDLRRKLRQGTPLTVRTDERRTARDAERSYRSRREPELRQVTHARTCILTGGRDAFAEMATEFAYTAGWGPRQKGVAQGKPVCMTHILGSRGDREPEIGICFQAYPPYAHFRRPGSRSSRRPPPAASP